MEDRDRCVCVMEDRKKALVVQTQKARRKREREKPDRGSVCESGISLRHLRHQGGRYYYPSLPSVLSRWDRAPVTKPLFKGRFYSSVFFILWLEEYKPTKQLFVKATARQNSRESALPVHLGGATANRKPRGEMSPLQICDLKSTKLFPSSVELADSTAPSRGGY